MQCQSEYEMDRVCVSVCEMIPRQDQELREVHGKASNKLDSEHAKLQQQSDELVTHPVFPDSCWLILDTY